MTRGTAVEQSFPKAFDWYRKAAEQGNPKAQLELAVMYAKAKGTPFDIVSAYQWLLLAEHGGQGDAKLKTLFDSRITPDQRSEANRKAAEWISGHQK
jgi:TPR repeat protein